MEIKANGMEWKMKEIWFISWNLWVTFGFELKSLEMMSVIEFDDLLFRTNRAVRYILNLAKDYLTYLSNDYFELSNL